MLSAAAFNAFLKTLEEPPAHVKFLLATTDPQKLPVTILSRCLQFSLKNMTPERIVEYLAKVLNAETVPYEEAALWALGRAAQGSMRDALSLTDQAIAFGEGAVNESQVNSLLGSMDRGRLFRLAEVMAKGDAAAILAETASMAEHSPDYDEIVQGLLHIWHRASLAQVVPDAIENAEGDREAILKLSMAMPAEDLQLCYQIALQGRKDLALAPDPRQGFEMILLRMLAFRPAPDVVPDLNLESMLEKKKTLSQAAESTNKAEPTERAESLEQAEPDTATHAATGADEPTAEVPFSSQAQPGQVAESEPEPEPEPEPISSTHADTVEVSDNSHVDEGSADSIASSVENSIAQAPVDAPPAVARQGGLADMMSNNQSAAESEAFLQNAYHNESAAADGPVLAVPQYGSVDVSVAKSSPSEAMPDIVNKDDLPELAPHTWYMWVEHLALAGLPMAIAKNSALIEVHDQRLVFDVDPAQGALFNETQRQRVEAALRELLPGVSIEMTLMATRGETPDQRRHRLKTEALYGARQAIDSDPVVNQILNELGGQVIEDSIRPHS